MVPRIVDYIKKNYPSEVLLLVSLGLCFGMALLSSEIGLSVAIGAFVMGVIISQSASQQEIVLKTMPIKEMFMAVFFVSIGMLIDPRLVLQNILPAIVIAAVFIVGKIFSVTTATYLANTDARSSMMSGMAMVAMGEFSFVIVKTGVENGSLSQFFYSTIIGAALITMIVMPHHLPLLVPDGGLCVCPSARVDHRLAPPDGDAYVQRLGPGWRRMPRDVRRYFASCSGYSSISPSSCSSKCLPDSSTGSVRCSRAWPTGFRWCHPPWGLIISVALVIPPLISIMRRMRRIVSILVTGLVETGRFHSNTGKAFFRVMTRLGYIFIFISLFFMLIPIAPLAKEFPFLIIVGVIVGILVTIWLGTSAGRRT